MIKRYRGTFEPENNGPIITAEFVDAKDFDEAVSLVREQVEYFEGANFSGDSDVGRMRAFITRIDAVPQRGAQFAHTCDISPGPCLACPPPESSSKRGIE